MSALVRRTGNARRLARLYLASRRSNRSCLAVLAGAASAWLLLALSPDPQTSMLVELVVPLLPAVVIGSSTWSPLGELEDTAARPLVPLRLMHLGGMFIAATDSRTTWVLLRNLSGYTGLALIGARLQGPACTALCSWVVPMGYVALVLAAGERLGRVWAWAGQPPSRDSALAVAVALLAVGLAVMLPARTWQRTSEGETV